MAELGQVVGHYRLVRLVGHGGMGDVFEAHDEVLKRRVALKSIRQEFRLLPEAKQRFLREAQTLSRLEHPNICRIHDLVEDASGDYLVLELIEGHGLRQWLEKGPGHPERLALAEQIADVLAAAHGKGVVHRDLKPENVMVTTGGQVKVLDFGLSRLVEEDPRPVRVELASAATRDAPTLSLAHTQAAVARTEAAVARTEAAAARTEAAVVAHREAAAAGGERTLSVATPRGGPQPSRDVPSPAAGELATAPLSRVGTIMGTPGYMSPEQARGESVTSASDMYAFGLLLQEVMTGQRAVGPEHSQAERLEMAVRGESRPLEDAGLDPDLAALVARLKSPDPHLRPTAVEACHVFRELRAKPLRRRRRILVAAAFAVLVLFSAATAAQAVRISREKARADREAESAKKALEFVASMFGEVDPDRSRGTTLTAKEILDHGQEKLGELSAQPLLEAQLARTLGDLYGKLGIYEPARGLLERAGAIFERELGPRDVATARNLNSLASVYRYQAKFAEAEARFRRALPALEAALGPDHPDVGDVYQNLAALAYNQGQPAEALVSGRRALAIREKAFGRESAPVSKSLSALAVFLTGQGRFEEAEPVYKQALAVQEKILGPEHRQVAETLNNLALLYNSSQKFKEALPVAERAARIDEKALGPQHPFFASNLYNVAASLVGLKRYADAEPVLRRVLAIRIQALGAEHYEVANSRIALGNVAQNLGQHAAADAEFTRALAIYEKALGPDHPDLGVGLWNAAGFYDSRGQHARAEAMLRRSLAILEKTYGQGHALVLTLIHDLAALALERRDRPAALAWIRTAVERGLDDPALLARDDLAPLRGDPVFEALAAEVKSRSARKPTAAAAK